MPESILPPPLDADLEADRQKLARTRWFGAALVPLSVGWMWFFLWRPLEHASRTGQTEFSWKAVILGPLLLYMGVCMLVTDVRDGQISWRDENGTKHYTRKGWWFIAGVMVVALLTLWAWTTALHRLGFTNVL